MRRSADRLQLQICWSYQTILNVSCPNAESYEALSTSLRKQTTMNEIQEWIKKDKTTFPYHKAAHKI